MKNILVFMSASDVAEKYVKPARKFAQLLAEHKFNLVYGASEKGLMKVVSSQVQKSGGKVIGITVEWMKESRKRDADEIIIAKTLDERKDTMLKRSKAIVVLVGGMGTIDEITHILETKKHGHHNKPIVFLNTANFYTGFKEQFQKMEDEGFLPRKLDELMFFAKTPEEVIQYLDEKREK